MYTLVRKGYTLGVGVIQMYLPSVFENCIWKKIKKSSPGVEGIELATTKINFFVKLAKPQGHGEIVNRLYIRDVAPGYINGSLLLTYKKKILPLVWITPTVWEIAAKRSLLVLNFYGASARGR